MVHIRVGGKHIPFDIALGNLQDERATLAGSVYAVYSCLRGQRTIKEKGPEMPYSMISHKVANYAKWKAAVRRFAGVRKASGEKCFYACRDAKHPNKVMVFLTVS